MPSSEGRGISSFWQAALAVLALIAIALYFLLPGNISNIPLFVLLAIGVVPLLVQIVIKLFKGNAGADLLGAIELVAAVLLAQYLAAALILLMLAGGQALEAYAVRRASSVLRLLANRMPAGAHRKTGGHLEDIAVSDIRAGDIIVMYPHETCPVDGSVVEGHGSMDESYLTGEPYRIAKTPGASVLSGAINGEALLTIRAEKLPQDSRYAQIMKVMAEAEQKRPQLRRLGDRLGGWFAVLALVTAGIVWLMTRDALRFLSILVIATPCPLIIAIPVTIISAISLAARRGIVIKDPAILEQLP
ncbi:MAG: heavy metal translocating P-type ATPase, partial [Pseudomonadota bacterium]|nr:heavy metal translocating P-type ATPase [Pseudomonadota bacterium]